MLRVLTLAGGLLIPHAAFAEDAVALIKEHIHFETADTLPEGVDFKITKLPTITDALQLQAFWIDQSTGQFVADVLRESGDVQRVSGFAIATLRVPAPTRQIQPGEILRANDLMEIEVPVNRINRFAVTDKATLVGQEVKRMLSKGRLIMAQSVMAPRVVERGQRVKISFSDAGMNLTANGKALNDASQGEEVKVVNLSSNLSVFGVAVADGVVEVRK